MHFATHPRSGYIHSGYVSGGWREPSFYKPADPQWSYEFIYNLGSGFRWVKKTPWTVLEDQNLQPVETSNRYTTGTFLWSYLQKLIDKEEEIVDKDQFLRQLLEASQKSRSSSTFEKKCKIFLSHAGAQKDFVEQLHEDLLGVHHFGVFFDKDDESLPKGERFPSRILKAANECDLAIVVMSDEYFRRKWPMLELASFVEAQRTRPEVKILPVFYKLSLEEFKQPERRQSYVESWKRFSPLLPQDVVQQWKEALNVISSSNGIHFYSNGELALRKEIVGAVCKRVPPDLLWNDSHVQGKVRMTEVIQEGMEASNATLPNEPPIGACFLGLYGMGGLGKTTMSHVFLNNMAQQFCGKVCYIELGSKDPLKLQKQLLVQLTGLDASLVNTRVTDQAQALYLLKEHIPKQRVCMVIDNVSDEQVCIGDAKALLNLQFKEGSVVLLTSRSLQTLKKLNIKWQACFHVPALNETEAMALFSYHAGCDTSTFSEDQWIMFKKFVRSCCFNVGDGAGQEYHPLALKVLGTQVGPEVHKWQETAIDLKRSINDKIHPVFSILKTSYDKLLPQRQKMFMDMALRRKNSTDVVWITDIKNDFEYLYGEGEINKLVEDLQAKSLVEYYNSDNGLIRIHELYREFAQMELQSEPFVHKRKCCLFRKNNIQPVHYQQQRLHVWNEDFSVLTTKMLCDCASTEMLTIEGCSKLTNLDIQGMENLAILEIVECPQLKTVCMDDVDALISISWEGFQGEYPNLANQQSLKRLRLISNGETRHDSLNTQSFDLSGCSNLDHLLLWNISSLPNFIHLGKLRNIKLNNCQHLKRFDGLEMLVCLEQLWLTQCSSLLDFPSLTNFPLMKSFLLHDAVLLKKLSGIAHMAQLESLSLKSLFQLEELHGIEACTKLTLLNLSGNSFQDFSWISNMPDLFFINFSCTGLQRIPDCSNLHKLNEIMLYGCVELETIDNLGFVQSLSRIDARRCWSLGRLPHLDGSAFTYLDISDSDIDDISCVEHCFQLEELHCARTLITTLPDLSNFQNLRVLDVHECWCLKRLDHIERLPALEVLVVWGCFSLETLPDLRSSKRLTRLDLMKCLLLDPNSVMLPSSHIHLKDANTPNTLEDHLSNFNDAGGANLNDAEEDANLNYVEGDAYVNDAEVDDVTNEDAEVDVTDEEGLPQSLQLPIAILKYEVMQTRMERAMDKENLKRMIRGNDTVPNDSTVMDGDSTSDIHNTSASIFERPLSMYMHQPIPQLPRI